MIKKYNLTLFLSRGASLRDWDNAGMLERELALYKRLQSMGARVGLVTFGGPQDYVYSNYVPGMKIMCNKWKLPNVFYEKAIPLLFQSWFRKCDVIKTNQLSVGEIALGAARMWRIPLVARCGYMWSDFAKKMYGDNSSEAMATLGIENRTFARAARIVVTTEDMRKDIERRAPPIAHKVVIVPNYVDTSLFRPGESTGSGQQLIFIGRLEPQKNIGALLEAITRLDVHLQIIGNGSLKDELKSKYGNMNGRLAWIDRVPHAQLPGHLNKADVFVLPSHFEGHPKALIEAMSCGLAVVGADAPGINGVITNGGNGVLCGTDADSIEQAIRNLLANQSLRRRLGKSARTFAENNYSLDSIAQKENDLLSSLAGA